MRRRAPDGEAGQVAGWEVVPFGLLVFVVGTLLIANAWAVVDARLAVDEAARAATRAYVVADDQAAAERAADDATRLSLAGHGRALRDLSSPAPTPDPSFRRCATVTVTVDATVPALALPFVGGFGHGFRVHGRHRGIIDPFRSGGAPGDGCGP